MWPPARATASPALTLRDITKRWAKRSVLEGINLTVEPGTLVWVGGRNGAGKTTLLRVVAGLIAPDRGSVKLHGLDPERDRRSYQQRIGFLSAGDRGLYARLSVRQNLDFWARLALIPGPRRRSAVDRALTRLSLDELTRSRVDRLSMGQRQRVRLAMTFLHEPEIVLLDEPRNSLDDDGIALLAAALSDLRNHSGAAIWCSPVAERETLGFDARYVIESGGLEQA